MTRIEGPDFICIGMPKAGTAWLFDQLQLHPDFWMPPIKKFGYLDEAAPSMQGAEKRSERLAKSMAAPSAPLPHHRTLDQRDFDFLAEATACAGEKKDLRRYAALFRFKGDKIAGDISPSYASMGEKDIAEAARALPQAKILLLVREPLSRVWSLISMRHRKGKVKGEAGDLEALRSYLGDSETINESLPTKIMERWAKAAPGMQFRHVLFDDIQAKPEETRSEILVYLGADPAKKSGDLPANYNRKGSLPKLELTDDVRRVLIDYFADEIRACAKLFGGAAKTWPARYGLA